MFNKILVGTDGYGPASRAVARAAELAEKSGAELLVAYSQPPSKTPEGSPLRDPSGQRGVDAGQGLLTDVEKHYGANVRIKTFLREGDPAEVLIDLAEEEDADLIVVGNRGMSKRFPLGVVANQVSHHAPCNVLIVRTTE